MNISLLWRGAGSDYLEIDCSINSAFGSYPPEIVVGNAGNEKCELENDIWKIFGELVRIYSYLAYRPTPPALNPTPWLEAAS